MPAGERVKATVKRQASLASGWSGRPGPVLHLERANLRKGHIAIADKVGDLELAGTNKCDLPVPRIFLHQRLVETETRTNKLGIQSISDSLARINQNREGAHAVMGKAACTLRGACDWGCHRNGCAGGRQDQVIKDRQALMKEQGGDMGSIKGYIDGKADQAKATAAASDLVETMKKIPDVFPAGTGGPNPEGKFTTKPEIWSDWNGFLSARVRGPKSRPRCSRR
jgi:cytochrome c556